MFINYALEQAEKISDNIVDVINEQLEQYFKLKNKNFTNKMCSYLENNKLILQPDMLLHGTTFNLETLTSIKEHGIVASEFANKKADMYRETFFMADFFKVVSKTSLEKLCQISASQKIIQYLSSSEPNNTQITFIIDSSFNPIQNYLKCDLFLQQDTRLYSFIDEEFMYSLNRRKRMPHLDFLVGQASIPFGVPFSFISGIVVGEGIERNKEKLNLVFELFDKLPVFSANGTAIKIPDNHAQTETENTLCQ